MKMRLLILTALVGVLVFGLTLAPTVSAQSATATVTANANLRAGPGTNFAKVGSASAGSTVTLAGCTAAGDWCRLTDGTWIFAELLDGVPAGLPVAESVSEATQAPATLLPATPTGTLGASSPRAQSTAAAANNRLPAIFYDPESLCELLKAERLNALTGLGWDDDSLGYFACVSDDLEVTPANYSRAGDVPNYVTYMVDSKNEDVAERIYLSLDVFNVDQATPAIREYKRLVSVLFDRLGLQIPAGLPAAIEAASSSTFTAPYGVVSLKRDAYNLGYGLEVQIADLKPIIPVAATPTTRVTPLPTSVAKPVAASEANLRSGPGTTYDRVGSVSPGEVLEIVGVTAAGDWYRLNNGAWIAAFLVNGTVGAVTVVAAPTPTPTPRPTSTPEIGNESTAERMCKDFVRRNLKAPSTASFGGWFDDWDSALFLTKSEAQAFDINTANVIGHGVWIVYGQVDAQNGFGAMIRSEYICVMEYMDTNGTWYLRDIMID